MLMPWQQGDVTETGFLFRSPEEGFQLSKPYGVCYRYDAILDHGQARWRAQVKSTCHLNRENVYRVRASRNAWVGSHRSPKTVSYTELEIDFMVVYIIPEKTWYVVPSSALKGRRTLDLYSQKHKQRGPWDKYKEAWDIFRHAAPCTCGREVASAVCSTTATSIPAPPVCPAPQPLDPAQP